MYPLEIVSHRARAASIPALATVLALSLTGCASWIPQTRAQAEDPDLAEMKRRIVELQEQAAVAEVELGRLRREVAELRAARGFAVPQAEPIARSTPRPSPEAGPGSVGSAPRVVHRATSDLIEVSDLEMPRPVPAPVGASPAGSLDRPEDESAGQRVPAPIEPPAPIAESLPVVVGAAASGSAPAVSAEIPPAAQALYDEGYTLYHQGRYLDAEAVFQRFLSSYGNLDLTDNALYWIGECRYARGDFEGALASFQETVSRFPAGNKVPAALLKSGRCFESLGDFANAKRAYEEVTSRYPDDPVAGVARQRVAQIR